MQSIETYNAWVSWVRGNIPAGRYDGGKLSPSARDYFDPDRERNQAEVDEAAKITTAIGATCRSEGPKLAKLSRDEFDALSNVECNFTWEQFRLPFNHFAVVFPSDYTLFETQGYVCNLAGIVGVFNAGSSLLFQLLFRQDKNHLWASGDIKFCGDTQFPVENYLHQNYLGFAETCEGQEMSELVGAALRVYMNSCQLLTRYAIRKIGYTSPDVARRLEYRSLKGNAPRDLRRKAQRELAEIPVIYGFDQNIRLAATEAGHPHSGNNGSGTQRKRPAFIHGHWKNQAVGPKWSEHRLIYINPVFLNRENFAGDMMDARTTMTLPKAQAEQSVASTDSVPSCG